MNKATSNHPGAHDHWLGRCEGLMIVFWERRIDCMPLPGADRPRMRGTVMMHAPLWLFFTISKAANLKIENPLGGGVPKGIMHTTTPKQFANKRETSVDWETLITLVALIALIYDWERVGGGGWPRQLAVGPVCQTSKHNSEDPLPPQKRWIMRPSPHSVSPISPPAQSMHEVNTLPPTRTAASFSRRMSKVVKSVYRDDG